MGLVKDEEFLKAYDLYSDAIFRHCFFRVFNRDLAYDLTQDTFVKTWEYLNGGRKVDNLRAFLYKVATNLIIDHSRKKKEASLEALLDQGFNPKATQETAEIAGKNLDFQFVIKRLEELEETDREAISLRYVEDLSPGEIAQMLGVSENVVSVRIHRALKKLKDLYD